MDLVVGVKTYVELEGEISMRELSFTFLNREVPIFPVYKEMIKAKERRYLKVEAPFLDEISSLGIIKLLTWDAYNTLTMKVNFERNKALEITNDSTQVIVLDPKRDIVILDIRSLGITTYIQGVLQQRLSKYYSFESLHNIFEGYNNFKNKLQEEKVESQRSISLVRTRWPQQENDR